MRTFVICLISVCAFSMVASAEDHRKDNFDSLLKQIQSSGEELQEVNDCNEAYQIGMSSASIATALSATEICQKATESLCEKFLKTKSVDVGTGDGNLVNQICRLQAARGSYLAVKSLLQKRK